MNVSAEHADALLELAYLVTAADGRLDDAELAAYRKVVASVRGVESVTDSAIDALLDRFAAAVDHKEIHDRVRELAPTLPAGLRETAFKLAVKLSVADLDASREEEVVQEIMLEALGISPERADELTAEVYATLDAGEGD